MTIAREVADFALAPNFATLSVRLRDGSIGSYVMWVHADDDHLLIATDTASPKFRAVAADPRVTVMIWKRDDPYDYVEVRGEVVDVVRGEDARRFAEQELAMKYRGCPYPRPDIAEWGVLRIRARHQRAW